MGQEELKTDLEKLQKALFMNKIIGIASMVCSLIVIILLFIGITKINSFTQEIKVLSDKVAELDIKQVNETVAQINTTLSELDFEYINESFKEVDMKAIGEMVETIDAAELEETLENINEVSEKLKKVSETISNFFPIGKS